MTETKHGAVKYSQYVPKQMFDDLKKLSQEDGITVSEHVRRAVSAYLYVEKTVRRKG